MSNKDQTEN